MLVFNYGSNLSKEQFARRCPTAKLVGIAKIKDHRLTFTGWSHGRKGSVATIVPAEGKEAVGAVYSLRSPEDVRALDAAEGFPTCYGCEEFTARVKVKGKWRKRQVWAYVKVDQREGQPSNAYLKTIAQGYKDHGLDISYLAQAITALPAVTHKPKPKPAARGYGGPKGMEWSWEKGWHKPAGTQNAVKAKPKKRAKGKKPRHPKKGKKRKARVIYVRKCKGLDGECSEELTNPCMWCPTNNWHCAHCCPQAAPWGHTVLY